MKKLYYLLIFILFILSSISVFEKQNKFKVFQIDSPTKIYVDINNNYIFDEKEPIVYNSINFINLNENPKDFENLSYEEKFFLNYKALETANYLLKNKFVTLNNNEIYLDNQKYSDLLLKSGFFYTNDVVSKENLINNLKTFDLNDYVILNTKTKKYHKINCPLGQKSKKIKIIRKSDVKDLTIKCKCSQLGEFNEENSFQKGTSFEFEKENIKVFFLDLNETFIPSSNCSTNACKTLKQEIDSAKKSIDFAIYGINNQPEIFNALLNAEKRGVKLRCVFDFDKKHKNYYKDTLKLKEFINDYNTDENYDLKKMPALMHNKFFVFDNQKVFTGSANITNTDLTGFNSNISLLVNSTEIANYYSKEFEQMLEGNFHVGKSYFEKPTVKINDTTNINVFFSPKDKIITTQIIPLIDKAKKSIYIPVFFITKKELIDSLKFAHDRGVDIKIINDATNAHSQHTIHKTLRTYGIKVKTENYAGKIHSKSLIIDDEISIIGSMNFSNSGENRNDENVMIIYDKDINAFLKSSFVHLWNKIPEKYEQIDARAESLESIGSCFDGVDNDFDGKVDKNDSACFI